MKIRFQASASQICFLHAFADADTLMPRLPILPPPRQFALDAHRRFAARDFL